MAISRYWRLIGFATTGNAALELSEARIYEGGVLADVSATLTATISPASGAVADLRDGVATGVVSWPYASFSAPAFALVWDFGAGLGVDLAWLRLGSGNTADNWPIDSILQRSTDGINWESYAINNDAAWPGVQTLTTASDADPNASYVGILLHGNGTDGSTTITDSSPLPKSATCIGNAQISTAQSVFGGSSILLDGAGDYLTVPYSDAFNFGTGDFSILTRVYLAGASSVDGTGNRNAAIATFGTQSGGNIEYWWLSIGGNTTVTGTYIQLECAVGGSFLVVKSFCTLAYGQFYDIAVCRKNGVFKIFLTGYEMPLAVSTLTTQSVNGKAGNHLTIGASLATGYFQYLNGRIEDFCTVKGVALFTKNYIPGHQELGKVETLLQNYTPLARLKSPPTTQRMLPAIAPPDGAARSHLRETPFFDAENGGTGTITDTVTKKALPANTPLHRRVLLMDQRSQMVFRETWSDAVTGTYTFPGVKTGVPYTVLAYDYTGQYRAVIADNILATP